MGSALTNIYKDFARDDAMTIQKAVAFLEKEAVVRSFPEIVAKFCHAADPKQLLVDGMKKNHPDLAAGSVEKRVRSWFQGKHSLRKQDAIELCFILQLSLEQADEFVSLISEEKLHWRDPDEITDIFSLMQGYSFEQARELKERMSPFLSLSDDASESGEVYYTSLIRREVLAIETVDELEEYLRTSAGKFGKLHNNAYRLFMQRLKMLEMPESEYDADEKEASFTIRDILREYLYEGPISSAKHAARQSSHGQGEDDRKLVFSAIQKNVIGNWPDETMLSKMKTRKTDVTRKTLILLLLATEEGFNGVADDWDFFEKEPSKEEVFEDVYGRLNQTLQDCGFAVLDPRSPFDWMILYSICVQDMFDADLRMEELFRVMFGEQEAEEGN